MSAIEVYVSLALRTNVTNQTVLVKDVATVYCQDNEIKKNVEKLVIYRFDKNLPKQKSITAMYIIQTIIQQYPQISVINIGETAVIAIYEANRARTRKFEYLKSAFVIGIVFFGSAFSIMTFNMDVSVKDMLENVRYMVMGDGNEGRGVIEVAYSCGLFFGILVFFNHFSRKKVKKDPTPIQIEMRKYEKDIDQAIICNDEREGRILDSN